MYNKIIEKLDEEITRCEDVETGSVKYISEADQERLDKLFNQGAEGIDILDEHWAHGGDEGLSYCYECCKKEVQKLRKECPQNKDNICIDGGWGTDGDLIAYCDTCGVLLANTLTDYGSEEEVNHFLEHGFDRKSKHDCYVMGLVINGRGWQVWKGFAYEESDPLYYKKLHDLCRQILISLQQPPKSPMQSEPLLP